MEHPEISVLEAGKRAAVDMNYVLNGRGRMAKNLNFKKNAALYPG
jgi:hypothetical protein